MTLAIREILFATDFSDVAREAGQTAADLARQFGARLPVLYVIGPCHDPGPAPGVLGGICAHCRALIRGESLPRKRVDERAGPPHGR